MPSRNGLVVLILKVALLVAAVIPVPFIALQDGRVTSVLPFLGAIAGMTAGSLLQGCVRRGDTRLRAVRGQVVGFLRSGKGGPAGAPSRWKPGLATPSPGRLDFQPQGRLNGSDDGELMSFTVHAIGPERDITVAEGFFRMGPTWRVVELSMPGGVVELAGPARDLRKAVTVLRRSLPAGGTASAV